MAAAFFMKSEKSLENGSLALIQAVESVNRNQGLDAPPGGVAANCAAPHRRVG